MSSLLPNIENIKLKGTLQFFFGHFKIYRNYFCISESFNMNISHQIFLLHNNLWEFTGLEIQKVICSLY